jgi:hypothetical protein
VCNIEEKKLEAIWKGEMIGHKKIKNSPPGSHKALSVCGKN